MLRLLTIVVLMGVLGTAWGEELTWLKGQVKTLASDSSLIQSYADRKQSYVYDQALALIAFSKAQDFATAERLAAGLIQTQNKDGSWYFSYYLDGRSPHPAEGDMRPNGAIAWATLALLTYQQQSQKKTFAKSWEKALRYLDKQMVHVPRLNQTALKFSQVDNHKTQWDERQVVALEHALDALAAFRLAHKLTGLAHWNKRATQLQNFSLSMWDEAVGHFWSGASLKTGKINRGEFYLDNQSWSTLALNHLPVHDKLKSALQASCSLKVTNDKMVGFKEGRRPASTDDFIWSEGTAGKALALEIQKTQCDSQENKHYAQTLDQMKVAGGVQYVDRPGIPDFAPAASVAGTAWTWFLRHRINPLDV